MRHRTRQVRPRFIWQGLLIVLPVLILAGFGILSLRQDRHLAEQEARATADGLAQQLASELGWRVSENLIGFEEIAARYWIGSNALEHAESVILNPGQTWSETYPNLNPDEVLFTPTVVSDAGELIGPVRNIVWATLPPAWLDSLTAAQRLAWDHAQSIQASTTDDALIAEAWHAFFLTTPTMDARANGEFALLRLACKTNSPVAATKELLRFEGLHPGIQSATGIPLGAVALATALRLGEPKQLDAVFLEELRQHLFTRPCLFAPYFLAEAESLAQAGPEATLEAVHFLRRRFDNEARQREIIRSVRDRMGLGDERGTNCWVTSASDEWLAIFDRVFVPSTAGETNSPKAKTNLATRVRLIPQAVMAHAFGAALRSSAKAVPSYFSLRVELAGRILLDTTSASQTTNALSPAATAAENLMPSPAPPAPAAPLARIGSASSRQGSAHRPDFQLFIYLADPGALYAGHRQRARWFGSLIIAIALIALIGFFRARKAFWREHELSEMKSNFVSSVSHELRAPIASVRLMAESLERGKVTDPNRQQQYFRFIVQECRRLSDLIANVLDFSRIEQGRKEYEFEPTDLAALVQDTVELMRPYASETGVQLVLRLRDGCKTSPIAGPVLNVERPVSSPVQPLLDGRAVQQALVNLLDNAIKHSPKNAIITIGLEFADGSRTRPNQLKPFRDECQQRWLLWVEDHGPGIPAAEQERIFERFYRLGSELRRETQGVGIGLSIVKHVAEAHGGRVTVVSEMGKGSKFILEFPFSFSTVVATSSTPTDQRTVDPL